MSDARALHSLRQHLVCVCNRAISHSVHSLYSLLFTSPFFICRPLPPLSLSLSLISPSPFWTPLASHHFLYSHLPPCLHSLPEMQENAVKITPGWARLKNNILALACSLEMKVAVFAACYNWNSSGAINHCAESCTFAFLPNF